MESPLARHPGLLLRKVAERLRLRRDKAPLPRPTSTEIALPPHIRQSLENWAGMTVIEPGLHSFSKLFGQEFDEAELLMLCSSGPVTDARDLTADIKLIWDFSRAHPLFLNLCVSKDQVAAGATFVRRWLKTNENTNGPAWTCAMDVAIRATNWIAADAISDGALGKQFGAREWAGWLWRHGAVIWRRLESRTIPSNHYLADLVGLIALGAVFPNDSSARRWGRFGEQEFPRALIAQTHPDGGLNEASLRYHAFVTEMALVARVFAGKPFPYAAEERIERMCQVLADFRDAHGDLFPFGDDDSGRVLALDHASALGRADVLLKLAASIFGAQFAARPQAIYPDSGWWIHRSKDWAVAVEFGGVGLWGHGSHAHSDDLSFCLEWRGQPLIVDPGTYAYTWHPEARNRLRSIAAHNTLIIDGKDPLSPGPHLFHLPGPDRPWNIEPSESSCRFEREIEGRFRHQRMLQFRDLNTLVIEDEVLGEGSHELEWRFHFAPQWHLEAGPRHFIASSASAPGLHLEVESEKAALAVEQAEFSVGYGEIEPCAVAIVKIKPTLPFGCRFTFRPAPGAR